MVMGSSNWPLPSQSYRVRLLLYLAEGIGIGAFLTLLLVEFFSIFLDIETGAFDFTITATDAVFFGFVLFLSSEEQPSSKQSGDHLEKTHPNIGIGRQHENGDGLGLLLFSPVECYSR